MKRFLLGMCSGIIFCVIIASTLIPLPTLLEFSAYAKHLRENKGGLEVLVNLVDRNSNNYTTFLKDVPEQVLVTPTNESIPNTNPFPTMANHSEKAKGLFGISIGSTEREVLDTLGTPNRIDLTPYGYTWWIYNDNYKYYKQIAIKDHTVVSLYSVSPTWEFNSIKIGMPVTEIQKIYSLKDSVSLDFEDANFLVHVKQSYDNKKYVAIDNQMAIEFYIDIHDNHKLSGIRISDYATFLATGGYSMEWSYYRNAPSFKALPLSANDFEIVNRAHERQILDITNAIRVRHQLQPLQWSGKVSDIARNHAHDMLTNGYFDHVSPTHGKLSNRFNRAKVGYRMIAENIAAGQQDAIEAVEAWMNSEGHRVNMLHKNYTHLGVGVIEKHYAQNFLVPY
ncbi:hypothetical protein BHU72_04635 [Desulfuribacillus stibiiarsenatis]|uniref:SCP domain-containing protein n=1 Tax=Desulfuribacillus stibiiarsenatis TaxID=1390249 RepID=A0A1E5L5I4_9FIRM|nr:CAP-associated domain-containing protein [Desulfuribacillus stibiiarsenatis]OEH85380.1 hypothetical protein BHU72_04635 [Desulfuribacillus stibiiarsenatis]